MSKRYINHGGTYHVPYCNLESVHFDNSHIHNFFFFYKSSYLIKELLSSKREFQLRVEDCFKFEVALNN